MRSIKWLSVLALSVFTLLLTNCSSEHPNGGLIHTAAQPDTGSDLIEKNLDICTALPFTGMTKPEDLLRPDINAFVLALNISSSFEGNDQWKNITNNFDGEGLSMGLLNQTLGTGSLEPLMVTIMEKSTTAMKSYFSSADYLSFSQMLVSWKSQSGFITPSAFNKTSEALFANDNEILSRLDNQFQSQEKILSTAESTSVAWAVKNLYTDTAGLNFKPTWKSELQNLAVDVNYRQLQFNAARDLHDKARGYQESLGLTQIRSYLFLFDIVVQNGGLYQSNLTDYQTFLKANPNATETQKLGAILTSRLKQVNSLYVTDVRTRKQSIIDGHGTVHGDTENYEKDYCYIGTSLY